MSNRANVPAFPRPVSQDPTGRHDAQDGATLREYLTGQALIGMLATSAGSNYPLDYPEVADLAVALADLTLIALEDVTHEDAVKRAEEAPVDPVTRDQERGPLPEGAEDQAPPAPQDPPSPESFRPKQPEGTPPQTDGEDEDIQF